QLDQPRWSAFDRHFARRLRQTAPGPRLDYRHAENLARPGASMDILFVATELAPMVKVGGLGDVVFALSKALRLLGHKVTILIPRYPAIEEGGVMLARRLTPLSLPALDGGKPESVTLFDGRLGSGVDLILIDKPGL